MEILGPARGWHKQTYALLMQVRCANEPTGAAVERLARRGKRPGRGPRRGEGAG